MVVGELLEPGKSELYRMANAEKRPDVEYEALWRLGMVVGWEI